MAPERPLATALLRHVEVDRRALATLRIAVAALVLADLALRAFDMVAFYTDAGVLPRTELGTWARIVPHAWSGALTWSIVLFLLAGAAAAMLLVGLRTTWATTAVFAALLSVQVRNTMVLNSGDILLLLTAFWGLFLPWGATGSVDAMRRRSGPEGPPAVSGVASWATAALVVQPVLVYTTNAVFKARSGTWTSGEAMRYAFVDVHTTGLGRWLAQNGPIEALGQAWFLLVLAAPLLLILRGTPRGVLAVLLAGGHLGMLATMRLGLFPLVSVAVLIPFLPAGWWDAFQRATPPRLARTLRARTRPLLRLASPSGTRSALPAAWCAPFLAGSVLLSAITLGMVPAPGPLDEALEGHDRTWAMFASPPRVETWYAAPVTLASGATGDALHDGPSPWEAPEHLGPAPEIRWRKYLDRLDRDGAAADRGQLAAYLCQRWDARHDEPAIEASLVRIQRPVAADGPPMRMPIGTFPCPQP